MSGFLKGNHQQSISGADGGNGPSVGDAGDQQESSLGNMKLVVLRLGCLVNAFLPGGNGSPRLFTYSEGEEAAGHLDLLKDDVLAALQDAVDAALKTHGIAGAVVRGANSNLAPARRSSNMGVVYNFSEFVIRLRDGVDVLARACVTVCVGPVPGSSAAEGQDQNYSKFWLRFRVSDLGPFGNVEGVVGLERDLSLIAPKMFEAMEGPYQQALRQTIGKDDLEIRCDANFRVLAVETKSDGFGDVFVASRRNVPLSDQIASKATARELAELGNAVIGLRPPTDLTGFPATLGADADFLVYESPDYYRGLFIQQVDDESVSIVGIAQAANIVSVRLVNQLGARF
jgi:hypothetical protein